MEEVLSNALGYIVNNCLVLIPVIYIIGMMLKGIETIPDKYIPFILLPIGILLAMAIMGLNASSVIQGILITGVTVYGNQILKQLKKDN